MDERIAPFRAHLLFERGLSENTAKAYCADVAAWFSFCESLRRPPVPPDEDLLLRFQRSLSEQGKAPSTQQRVMAAIRTWMHFLVLEGLNDGDARLPSLPPLGRRLPHILGEGEVVRILEACSGSNSAVLDRRDRALLETAYGCGLRASELCTIHLSDIDYERRILRVLGKGDKERSVPFTGEILHRMNEFRENSRPFLDVKGRAEFFLSRSGNALRREDVWRIIRKRGRKAGIASSRLYPHILRHSLATHLLRRGMDLRTLQEMLGHSSIATTEKYVHFDLELRDIYDTTHPRA